MDYNTLTKDDLKEVIKASAEAKDYDLPKSWHLMKEENLVALANEIDAFNPEPEKEYSEPKVKGNSSMKEKILAKEKVPVYVPEDMINNTTHVDIWVNGVHFIYAREKEYMMPKPVAEVYNRAVIAESKARKKMSKFSEFK